VESEPNVIHITNDNKYAFVYNKLKIYNPINIIDIKNNKKLLEPIF
jgi:hypothetical protein